MAHTQGDARNGVGLALAVGYAVTVLAQIEPRFAAVYMVLWPILVLYLLVFNKERARFSGMPFVVMFTTVILVVYCSACFLCSGETGYLTGFCQLYLKCVLMYLIGFLLFSDVQRTGIWKVALLAYVAASFAYAIWAVEQYFPGFGAWLSTMEYLFASKNSFGQIVGVAAIVLVVFALECQSQGKKIAAFTMAVFLACSMLLMQCRTALLAGCLALVYLLWSKKRRTVLFVLAAVFLVCLALVPELQDVVTHALLLDKYAGADMNTLSHGRIGFWDAALDATDGHEMFGVGDYYVDSMYIDVYVNLGFVGFVLVMGVWVARVLVNVRRGARMRRYGEASVLPGTVACLTVFYLVESLFEGYPPFGPGTCSFVFWMLCGYLDGAFLSANAGSLVVGRL